MCLHINASCCVSFHLYILVCANIKMFSFSRVRLDQNGRFFSCVLASIFACTCVRLHQKMVPFSHARLHQNVCLFSCAPKSRFLYFLVCIYINFVSFFSCAPSSECLLLLGCACIKMFTFLVCIYINFSKTLLFLMLAFFRVHLHQFCVYLCAPT